MVLEDDIRDSYLSIKIDLEMYKMDKIIAARLAMETKILRDDVDAQIPKYKESGLIWGLILHFILSKFDTEEELRRALELAD